MSSKTVTKHKKVLVLRNEDQTTQSGGFLFLDFGRGRRLRRPERNGNEKRAVVGASPYGKALSVRITERSGVTLAPAPNFPQTPWNLYGFMICLSPNIKNIYLKLYKYSDGDTPMAFLNSVEKYL